MIDAHHHLWDLEKVSYPWLEAKGVVRFFGDPTPIQRNYLLKEFCEIAKVEGFGASAPAPELFKHYGFSDENVTEKLKAMINR